MRIAIICWTSCVIACATNASLPPPSSLQVDPLGEVIAIPPGSCLGLDDHFAMSTNAVRSLLVNMRETDTRHAIELATCSGAGRVLKHQLGEAVDALKATGWWQRWAPPLLALTAAVFSALGVVTGFSLGRK